MSGHSLPAASGAPDVAEQVGTRREPPPPSVGPVEEECAGALAELVAGLGEESLTAVDALQIAALLESSGLSDRVVRDRYGCADVFALADEVFDQVRGRPPVRGGPGRGPAVRLRPVRDSLRGGLFGIPGLFYLSALRIVHTRAASISLAVALVVSWGWGQGMSVLGYRLLGRAGKPAAFRAQRVGLCTGLPIVVGITGLVGLGLGTASKTALVLAALQTLYLLSASVLLMFDEDVRLLLVLVPGGVASVAYLLGNSKVFVAPGVLAAVAGSILLAVASAWLVTSEGPRASVSLTAQELRTALPFFCYGTFSGMLLLFSTLDRLLTTDRDSSAVFDVAILPLVLSMGVAEWQLRGYRRSIGFLLGSTSEADGFARRSWSMLLESLGRYWLALWALTVAVAVVAAAAHAVRAETVVLFASYFTLGGAFFIGLILIAASEVGPVLLLSGTALCSGVGGRVVTVVLFRGPSFEVCHLAMSLGLLGGLVLVGRDVLTKVTSHWTLA